MSRLLAAAASVALALALTAAASGAPLAAPTSVATKMQLRGHLPDLGEIPAMWVFNDASAYDAFRIKLDIADVLPDSGSLYMTFDRELLALYTRGNDTGGRCLRAGSISSVTATTVTLDLSWDVSSCGAPASAHYPFVLVSLARAADDGSAWMAGRQVCGSAPGVDGSRACAPASGAAASPSPTPSRTASPAPTSAPSTSPTPSATETPPPPRTSIPASPTTPPSRTLPPTSSPTPTAVVAGSSGQNSGPSVLDIVGWVAVGLVVGVFVTALVMRPRVYRV